MQAIRRSWTFALVVALLGFGAARANAVEVERDLEYAKRGERALLLDAYVPAGNGPFAAVLVVHGGGWRSGNRAQLSYHARGFARAGLAAFAIDYRLAPEHKWPAQIDDVRAALAWVKANAARFRVDPAAIGAYGYSAGGHLVALLGTDAGAVQAVVAGGAPCDLSNFPSGGGLPYLFGATRQEDPASYRAASPLAQISGDEPPMLFFHGTIDLIVPVTQPRRMVEALRAAGREVEILEIPWAGHFAAAAHPRCLERATEHFRAKLKPRAAATGERGVAQVF